MTVAQTILDQLGGNKFAAMTGIRNFGAKDEGLCMMLPKNKSKANHLEIILTPYDDYSVVFTKREKSRDLTVFCTSGIYCDQLQEVFTRVTGLYTSL